MKDCGRPDIERCGICDACESRGMAKEVMHEAKKQMKGCLPSMVAVVLCIMLVFVCIGAGIGLVYVGFRFVIDLFGG